jgi:hypothetical protein
MMPLKDFAILSKFKISIDSCFAVSSYLLILQYGQQLLGTHVSRYIRALTNTSQVLGEAHK